MINGNESVYYGLECAPNGCNFYRIKQPFLKLVDLNPFPCAVTSLLKGDEHELWLEKADVIVTQGATSERFLEYITETKGHKKFILDYDDDIFSVSPFNPSYERHGVKEVDIIMPDGTKHEIRDGKFGFNIKENRKRLFIFSECLKNADLITTPSPILAGKFKQFNKNVKVIRNYLDFKIWNPLSIQKDEFVRIGYQGGWSHFQDFLEIKDVLVQLMYKYKNLIFVLMGQSYEGALKDFPQDRVQIEEWTNIEVYPWKFKTLGIDIGIAPLVNNEFNTAKSEIKWEEYSALGIPTCASNIPPYSLNIADGDTGFLCCKPDDWKENLSALIESSDLRKKIGDSAMAYVKENYSIDKNITQYIDAYKGVLGKELILV